MKDITEQLFTILVYVAGDFSIIKQVCRKYCMEKDFCVIITPADFIYMDGEKSGVCISIVNYPGFLSTKLDLIDRAIQLAKELIKTIQEWPILVITPKKSIWIVTGEETQENMEKWIALLDNSIIDYGATCMELVKKYKDEDITICRNVVYKDGIKLSDYIDKVGNI